MKLVKHYLILTALLFISVESAFSVTKVARVINMLEFYGGSSVPLGSYDGLGQIIFTDQFGNPAEFDADFIFDQTFTVGVNYGQLRGEHWMVALGLRFTKVNIDDSIQFNVSNIKFRQYDLDISVNYTPLNLQDDRFSPYLGIGFGGGLLVTKARGFSSENDATAVGRVNFGIDFKLFSSESGRSFITISSVNSWDFAAANNRPKYLNIGGAIKYWFRP